ncbi:MAG: hypothetical protein ACLUDK_07105 [Clostridium paraputrificum]
MGKKLSQNEHLNSIGALREYYFKHNKDHGPFVVDIEIVDKNTNEIEKLETKITIAFDSIMQRINILWEDAGYTREEFRDKGLFGYYDCTWVPMDFNFGTLEINSPDSNKIVYVS